MKGFVLLSFLLVFSISSRVSLLLNDLQSKEIQIKKNCDSNAVFINSDTDVHPTDITTLTQYSFYAAGIAKNDIFIKNLGIQVLYNGRQLITFSKEINTKLPANEEFSYTYNAITPATLIAGQYTIYLRLYDQENKSLSCLSLKFSW